MRNTIMFLGETADKQFKTWQSESTTAFYLNIIGKRAMQHKADCWHLGDGEGMNSASNSKVCSDSSSELQEWAKENKLKFESCSHCCKQAVIAE